jgi:hypothetical protein
MRMGTAEELAAHLGVPIMTADECFQLRYKPEIQLYVMIPVTSQEELEHEIAEQNAMCRQLAGVVPGNPIRILCIERTP